MPSSEPCATPFSAAGFIAGASLYRQAGCRVQLVVLAVRAADSRQGTASRYAEVNELDVPAEFTTAAGHDSHFAVLPEVVSAAQQLRNKTAPYTPEEAARFWTVQRWLHGAMPEYLDYLIAIAGLACPMMPAQQPRQPHTHVPTAALPMPA
ncbi:hypothetical protein ACWCQS_41690 [Streptomyces sp. NPDC002076]